MALWKDPPKQSPSLSPEPLNPARFDVPEASDTEIAGVNNVGELAGSYRDSSGAVHGFVETNGLISKIGGPLASDTYTKPH